MKSIEESVPSCVKGLRVEQEEKGALKVVSVFHFPSSFPGFSGHFPDNPILPGIVQLSTVRYLAEQAVQKQLLPFRINKTKFRSMIHTDQDVTINLELLPVDNQYECKFSIRSKKNEMPVSEH